MPRRHSEKAKRGTKLGLLLRMNLLKAKIRELDIEIKLYQGYLKHRGLSTRWFRRVLYVVRFKKRIRERQLARYEAKWKDYKRRGLI